MAAVRLPSDEIAAFLDQAVQLYELTNHHAWPAYEKLIRDLRLKRLEELAEAKDPADMRAIQGAAQVLGQLLALPEQIQAHAEALKRETDANAPRTYTMDELRAALSAGDDADSIVI